MVIKFLFLEIKKKEFALSSLCLFLAPKCQWPIENQQCMW